MVGHGAAVLAPDLHPGACTHARALDASCQACEDVCAEIAIFPAGPDLHLDPTACSGCGACVAACPQRALAQPQAAPVIAARRSGQVAVALCARHPAAQGRAAATCVHALSLADLATLLADGIVDLALATGDCEGCAIRPLTTVDDPLARLAAICASRGLLAITARPAGPGDLALLPAADPLDDPARRALFRAGSPPPAPPPDPRPTLVALHRHAARDQVPVFAFSPAIDAARCTGCDACVTICPAQALVLGAGPAYHADAARCTGCALCLDVCDVDAVTVTPLAAAAPDVALSAWRCRACGVPSHAPGAAPADGLCRICRETGHHKKLFQVFT
ncbi:4Fe-4S binding protein [Paracoccus sp. p4-l81]|uniref:4Fe-4S binding protein n=1 Tax=unclassified Paracoccus (in: a-proteobacteria) TaxID=2688777 RepID=UPI0035B9A49E